MRSVNVEMFPPLDLPKYSFFFLNFTKLFTFVLLSNEGARVTMWVPMLVLAACIYFVCKDRAKKFARFVDSWSHVIQIIDVVRCMQANHSVLSNTWRWRWPRFEQSKVFLLSYHNLPTTPLCAQGLCNDQKWLYRRFTVP